MSLIGIFDPMVRDYFGGGSGGGADWNASEGEAGYVKNRTHYEEVEVLSEAVNITWDGNTEGLLSDGGFFYKVSDLILTDAQIKASTIDNSAGQIIVVGDLWDVMVSAGYITPEVAFLEAAVIVRTPNADFSGMKFPECGVYFMQTPVQAGGTYATALTAPEQVTTTVKPLDEKYMPILTSPSGKKFKLTVDDSGTVSAVEVTE